MESAFFRACIRALVWTKVCRGGKKRRIGVQMGVFPFTWPGCSHGVWNSACWHVSLTFLYLGRLLLCWVLTESSFFLRIFLHDTTERRGKRYHASGFSRECVYHEVYQCENTSFHTVSQPALCMYRVQLSLTPLLRSRPSCLTSAWHQIQLSFQASNKDWLSLFYSHTNPLPSPPSLPL